VPLLADYIHNDSKGTCSAILVLMSSFGALGSAELNTAILNNIDKGSKITVQYLAASGITLVVGKGFKNIQGCFILCFVLRQAPSIMRRRRRGGPVAK
jgi:hypothetical protein